MHLDSSSLIQAVRDQILEQNTNVVTDNSILRRLNFAYQFAYNHIVKGNDSMYARAYFIDLTPGVSRYPLPRQLYGKRIEQVLVPMPVASNFDPLCYTEVPRVDPQHIYRNDLPRQRTIIPTAWSTIGRDFWLVPQPTSNNKVKLLVTPTLIPLAKLQGRIMDFDGNTLTLDNAPDGDLVSKMAELNQNYLSVCDGMTGELKGVFGYEEISGTTVTLGKCASRTEVMTHPIYQVSYVGLGQVGYDPLTGLLSAEILSGDGLAFSEGDNIEIAQDLPAGTNVNIVDNLIDETDFYDRPEYAITALSFSRGGIVTAVTARAISWVDSSYVPPFTNGYLGQTGVAITGNLVYCAVYTFEGSATVKIATATPHGLTQGIVQKLVIAGTGTNADGANKKCIAISDTEIVVLQSTFTGVYSGVGTFTQYQYPNNVTGTPQFKQVTYSTPNLVTMKVYKNSPYALSLQSDEEYRNPDSYKPENDISIDDVVTWGLSTAVPIIPESMHEMLVEYAVLSIKSSLNESDTEIAALLKEQLKALAGDSAGRNLGVARDSNLRGTQTRRYNRVR